jgi:hypothetical protein
VAQLAGDIDITMGNSLRFVFPRVIPFILNLNISLRVISIPFS